MENIKKALEELQQLELERLPDSEELPELPPEVNERIRRKLAQKLKIYIKKEP